MEPGFYRFNTAFLASLDEKTAFDVAKFSVVARIFSLTRVHGHVAAALLAEIQGFQGSACFENCETQFSCIRQGGVEAPVLWRRVAKYVVESRGKVEGQKTGTYFQRRERQRIYDARYDVGGQSLVIL